MLLGRPFDAQSFAQDMHFSKQDKQKLRCILQILVMEETDNV